MVILPSLYARQNREAITICFGSFHAFIAKTVSRPKNAGPPTSLSSIASVTKSMELICLSHELFPAWYLEYVDIDAPSLGLKWHFRCGRWLATDKDDGLLERELFPTDDDTITYVAKIPYEISGNPLIG